MMINIIWLFPCFVVSTLFGVYLNKYKLKLSNTYLEVTTQEDINFLVDSQ